MMPRRSDVSNLLIAMDDPDQVAAIVDEVRREARYVVTDFSVELVISKFKEEAEHEGDIYVPDYQRSLSWGDERSSYFIESLLLRVPVPPISFTTSTVASKLSMDRNGSVRWFGSPGASSSWRAWKNSTS